MTTSLLSTATIRSTAPDADLDDDLDDEARVTTEVDRVIRRLESLATEQEALQAQLTALRDERDQLILRGLAHGMSSSELAARSRLTGARVRAIADAAAASSARERVATAVARLVAHTPALCTTYGALASAVGIGSAKGVASSLASNPDVSACCCCAGPPRRSADTSSPTASRPGRPRARTPPRVWSAFRRRVS